MGYFMTKNNFVEEVTFKYLMTAWSIGWDIDVVFGGRNINLTLDRSAIVGCARQLLIISVIFRFSLEDFASNSNIHFSKRVLSYQLLVVIDIEWQWFNGFSHTKDFRFVNYKYWEFMANSICWYETSDFHIVDLKRNVCFGKNR